VLELAAIYLDNGSHVASQRFGGGFHQSRLACASGSEKQKGPDGTGDAAHPERERLIDVDDLPDRIVLTDNLASQTGFELMSFIANLLWVQELWVYQHHFCCGRSISPLALLAVGGRNKTPALSVINNVTGGGSWEMCSQHIFVGVVGEKLLFQFRVQTISESEQWQ
jgi:hypothetical protein